MSRPSIPVTETTRFGSGYETVNRFVGRRSVSPLAQRINTVLMPASLALSILTVLGIHGNVRIWLTVLVVAFGPGSALVQYFRLPDAAMQLGLILTIGFSIIILLAQAMLLVNDLSPVIASIILTGLTFLHPITRQNKRSG